MNIRDRFTTHLWTNAHAWAPPLCALYPTSLHSLSLSPLCLTSLPVSPWCAIFSEENFQVLEYSDDLIFYYKDGYGHDINWKMTSPLVRELESRLSGLVAGTNEKKVFIYLSHSEATNTLLPVLGW